MKTQTIISKPSLSVLAIAAAMVAFTGQPAVAQTAENLDCNGCVNSSDIKVGGVKRRNIGSKAVTTGKLKNGAVTSGKIAAGAVTGAKVQDSSLTGSDIAAQSVPAGVLSNGAGADFDVTEAANGENFDLIGIPQVYRTVVITAPSAGLVILNASGYIAFDGDGICSISRTPLRDDRADARSWAKGEPAPAGAFGITWGEEVTAGTHTWNLVCEGVFGDTTLRNPALTAMFFPTRY